MGKLKSTGSIVNKEPKKKHEEENHKGEKKDSVEVDEKHKSSRRRGLKKGEHEGEKKHGDDEIKHHSGGKGHKKHKPASIFVTGKGLSKKSVVTSDTKSSTQSLVHSKSMESKAKTKKQEPKGSQSLSSAGTVDTSVTSGATSSASSTFSTEMHGKYSRTSEDDSGGKAGRRREVLNAIDEIATNQYGMYRPIKGQDKNFQLPILIKHFAHYYPWPPKSSTFLTSGYYEDMATGGGDVKSNEIFINNLSGSTTEKDIRMEFPQATKIILNPDDSAIIVMDTPEEADQEYNKSKMVKQGERHLKWMRRDEMYLLQVPANVTESDLITEFPDATEVYLEAAPEGDMDNIDELGVIGWTQVGTLIFDSPAKRDKALGDTNLHSVSPQQLKYKAANEERLMLKISNLTEKVKEDHLRKRFPNATSIMMDIQNGNSHLTFQTEEEALNAYNDSGLVKLGKPKVGWIRPQEFYILEVPLDLTVSSFYEEFPSAKKIKFQIGEHGKRVVTVVFSTEEEQRQAYSKSRHKKVGKQRLGLDTETPLKDGGYDPNATITVENLAEGIELKELKKKFSNAVKIDIDQATHTATINYKTIDDANKNYMKSGLVEIPGQYKMRWNRPNEIYLKHLNRSLTETPDELKAQEFPAAAKVEFIEDVTDSAHPIAVFTYNKTTELKEDSDKCRFKMIKPHVFRYEKDAEKKVKKQKHDKSGKGGKIVHDTDNLDGMTVEQLATFLYDVPEVGFSNISNIFTPAIKVYGLPRGHNRKALFDLFPDSNRVDFELEEGKKVAVVEFSDAHKAAQAFGLSRHLILDGHRLEVQPATINDGSGQKKKKRKHKHKGKETNGENEKSIDES